jgi:outer membrane protein
MNNRILKLLFPLAFSLPCLQAMNNSNHVPTSHDKKTDHAFSIEAQAAAFFPLGSTLRRIYGSALPLFTLAETWRFHKYWAGWIDVSYVFGNGHSVGNDHKSTHLNFIPITAGIKYCYQIGKSDLYIGIGPCYSFVNTVDRYPYVHRNNSANNFGATIKTGFIYNFKDRWFFQSFFNYMYQKMYFHQTESDPFVYRYSANLSSLQLGGGFGFKF